MATAHYMSGLVLLATGKFDEAKPMLSAVVGVNVEGLPLDDGELDIMIIRRVRKLKNRSKSSFLRYFF